MANSSHVRSISFPSRSQPEYLRVEIEPNRLKTWESSSISSITTPLSLNTIQEGLVGIAELYNCVQDLLESQTIQQALLKHQMERLADEVFEASVGLIDSCGMTRELVLMMKEQVQDLQSALSRKGGDSNTQGSFNAYISLRKKVKKDISKSLKALKQEENKIESSTQVTSSTKTSINLDNLSPKIPTLFLVFASFKGEEKWVVIDFKDACNKTNGL